MRDMVSGVDAGDLRNRRRTRLDLHETIEQAAYLDQIAETTLGLGILRMRTGLDRQSGRKHLRPIAGVVPHVKFMADEPSSHASNPLCQATRPR